MHRSVWLPVSAGARASARPPHEACQGPERLCIDCVHNHVILNLGVSGPQPLCLLPARLCVLMHTGVPGGGEPAQRHRVRPGRRSVAVALAGQPSLLRGRVLGTGLGVINSAGLSYTRPICRHALCTLDVCSHSPACKDTRAYLLYGLQARALGALSTIPMYCRPGSAEDRV